MADNNLGYLVGDKMQRSFDNERDDRELGRKIAREDAKRQIWPLEGYLLKDKLAK